jgi:hypothetical protein
VWSGLRLRLRVLLPDVVNCGAGLAELVHRQVVQLAGADVKVMGDV